jgi:hypothetical protein
LIQNPDHLATTTGFSAVPFLLVLFTGRRVLMMHPTATLVIDNCEPYGRNLSHNINKNIMAPASDRVRRPRTTTTTTTTTAVAFVVVVPALRRPLPLLLVSILLLVQLVRADFSETDCLNCVGSRYISDNLFNRTYCEVDGVGFETDQYDCVAETDVSTLCMSTGDKFYIGQDCRDEEETSVAVTIVAMIIVIGCCVGIIGGIVACVCCCVKAGQPHHPHPQYHHDSQYRYGASTVTTSGVGTTAVASQPSFGVQSPAHHHYPHPLHHHQQQVLPVVLPGVFQQQQPSAATPPSGIISTASTVQSGTTIATPVHPQQRAPHEEVDNENPAASFLGRDNNNDEASYVPFAEAVALDQSVMTANKPTKLSVISIDP